LIYFGIYFYAYEILLVLSFSHSFFIAIYFKPLAELGKNSGWAPKINIIYIYKIYVLVSITKLIRKKKIDYIP